MIQRNALLFIFALFAFSIQANDATNVNITAADVEKSLSEIEFDMKIPPLEAVKALVALREQAKNISRLDLSYKAESILTLNYAFLGQNKKVTSLYQRNHNSPYGELYPEGASRIERMQLKIETIQDNKLKVKYHVERLNKILDNPRLTNFGRSVIFKELGATNLHFDDYISAIKQLKEAYRISDSVDINSDQQMLLKSAIQDILAELYGQMGDHEKSVQYTRELLDQAIENDIPVNIQLHHYQLSFPYFKMGNWQKSLDHSLKSAEMARLQGEMLNYAYSLEMVSESQIELGMLEEAAINLEKVLEIYRQEKEVKHSFFVYVLRAKVYALQNRYELAEKDLLIAKEMDHYYSQASKDVDYLETSYKVARYNQDYAVALADLEKLLYLKENSFKKQQRSQAQRLAVEFEVEKINGQAKELKRDNRIKTLELKEKLQQESWYLMIISFSSITMTLLVIFIYRERVNKKQIHKMAMTDPLTGAPNRRLIETIAMNELEDRKNESTTVCLIDIDHFKKINDTYGHDVGDKALKHFVKACNFVLRKGDSFGRFGGEEFLLILPNASKKGVEYVFERLQSTLVEHPVPNDDGEDIVLTFSMGAATVNNDSSNGKGRVREQLSKIIKLADECVYKAKDLGRDTLVVA